MPETLKLAVVTDIHRGPDKMTKAGSAAVPLPKDFTTFAEACPPGFFVELGDRISVIDTATDRQQLRMIATQFADLSAPDLHLLDNHDQVHLSIADNGEILGESMDDYNVDIYRRHLVFW